MRARLVVLVGCLAASAATAGVERASSPPLRWPADTRSTFCWAPWPAGFPQALAARVRVDSQHRETPHPWEVAWVVIGDQRHFAAFVPKPTGWHLEIFDADKPKGKRQRFLASGGSPKFPVGSSTQVGMIAWEGGVLVGADGLFLDWRWREEEPAPGWWGRPARAGVYLEDCRATVEWARRQGA